ncbi:MAG: hypothetical protein SGVNAXEH_000308 [Holophagaceae bacterium]|jgi:GMP synthase (glutamine-hydrolysing)
MVILNMSESLHHERIAIIDFGSQYTRLIARRLREVGAFGLVYNSSTSYEEIKGQDLKGIILSGGPSSVFDKGAPTLDSKILNAGVPILGICYGQQLIAKQFGGNVHRSSAREYGKASINLLVNDSVLFQGLQTPQQVWMSHGDHVESIGDIFRVVGQTTSVPVAAMESLSKKIFAIQFHPEVTQTEFGLSILKNFCNFSGMHCDWSPQNFIEEKIHQIQSEVGKNKAILGLSGGVDSSVAALLLHRAIGSQLHCMFIDTGLLRLNERIQVQESFKPFDLQIHWIDAANEFLEGLSGVSDPELKRKKIGAIFIEVFEREAKKLNATFLAQGTTYPDVIESQGVGGAVLVKSHHNVGGLPERLNLKIVEPLRELFKDEVRAVGRTLGLPPLMVARHPFPGPGLAVRIPGSVDREKVRILQEADAIFIHELIASGWYERSDQAFVVLLPVRTVGIMGDERTYEYMCTLRAVTSEDFMTADWTRLPYDLLEKVAQRIVNEVKGINRVSFDITSKPPATIEYE